MSKMIPTLIIALCIGIGLVSGGHVAAQEKFVDALDKSTESIQKNLERTSEYSTNANTVRFEGTKKFVYDVVDKFVFPLLIIVSILVVILGLVEIMVSTEDNLSKGIKYVGYGVLGIIIIQSAKFITATYTGILTKVAPDAGLTTQLTFSQSAYEIYNQLIMPFVNIIMYVVLGALFVILLVQVLKLITESDEATGSKARTIIISNVTGIIVILLAKTIVEAIYGKQSEVLKNSVTIGESGSGILGDADLTPVFTIINYILGLIALIILIVIIIQTYQLLVNPTNEELIKKVKTNIVYILLGVGLIALAYVIVNLFIIK